MVLKFYREEDDKWYVDLPEYIEAGGDKESLEMVFGADEFLEKLVNGAENEVTLEIATNAYDSCYDSRMKALIKSNNKLDSGAFYVIDSADHVMWLCDVVKYLFGEFPEIIYFRVI
jgi:hypothetical protein